MHTSEIRIRDPFVVPSYSDKQYYLYGTTDGNCWGGQAVGFDAYRSCDLQEWEGPFPVFRPQPEFWATENFWAPEVHVYNGRCNMFASFKAPEVCRGTQILVSDSLLGPFGPLSELPVTPSDWECLDGTLHIDADGNPWIVFCHEWVQVRNGEIWAMPLTPDLAEPLGDPIMLFRASDASWAEALPESEDFVTDGPFLHRCANGDLLLLWSSFRGGKYALGVAHSASGTITGPWEHESLPLYADDGGHGMLFTTFAGNLMLSLHKPNTTPLERPMFIPLVEHDGRLVLRGD